MFSLLNHLCKYSEIPFLEVHQINDTIFQWPNLFQETSSYVRIGSALWARELQTRPKLLHKMCIEYISKFKGGLVKNMGKDGIYQIFNVDEKEEIIKQSNIL